MYALIHICMSLRIYLFTCVLMYGCTYVRTYLFSYLLTYLCILCADLLIPLFILLLRYLSINRRWRMNVTIAMIFIRAESMRAQGSTNSCLLHGPTAQSGVRRARRQRNPCGTSPGRPSFGRCQADLPGSAIGRAASNKIPVGPHRHRDTSCAFQHSNGTGDRRWRSICCTSGNCSRARRQGAGLTRLACRSAPA